MSNFRKKHLEERYCNDAAFYQVVQSMNRMICDFGITPSEMREALFLAHYRYEMENPSAIRNQVMIRMSEFWDKEE